MSEEVTSTPVAPAPPQNLAAGIVKALRPRQWVKNLLVFAAPLAALGKDVHYSHGLVATRVGVAFVVFCMAASCIYLINDARDIEADRAQPTITKYPGIGRQPYDALVTPDGRYFMAGLYGEDGVALLDLWVAPIKADPKWNNGDYYGKGEPIDGIALDAFRVSHLERRAVALDEDRRDAEQLGFEPTVCGGQHRHGRSSAWQRARLRCRPPTPRPSAASGAPSDRRSGPSSLRTSRAARRSPRAGARPGRPGSG